MQVRWRRFPVTATFAILGALLIASCGGGGGGGAIVFAPNPPGPEIVKITICEALPTPTPPPPASPTPTPKRTPVPAPTPCPAATTTSVAQASTIAFSAQATNNLGGLENITNAASTLWTSTDRNVLDLLAGEPGVFSGVSPGCACIAASSGGISSAQIAIAVFAPPSTPSACSCPITPTPTATPGAAPMAARAELSDAGTAGILQWTFDAHAPIRGPLVAAGDRLYFITTDDVLHALDPSSTELWRIPARTLAPIRMPSGAIVIQGADFHLYAISPDRAVLWRIADPVPLRPLTVALDGTSYAASPSSLFSFSPDGVLNWRFPLDAVAAAAPLPDGGVLAGVASGDVVALAADGTPRWSLRPGAGFSGGIAVGPGQAFFGSISGGLYAVSLDGTDLKPVASTRAAITSGPVAGFDGIIYFGSELFYAFSAGGIVWQADIDAGDAAPTPLRDGALLAGADGRIASLRADGTYRWAARLAAPIHATPAAASGLVYIGADDGRIYAIR